MFQKLLELLSKLFESYITYLTIHPDLIVSKTAFAFIMIPFWIIMFKYRKEMVSGVKGANTFWEAPEQYAYITIWIAFPIIVFSATFQKDLPVWVWWILSAIIGYTIGGRWIFEWLLALRAGKTEVTETVIKTASVKETEIKQETSTQNQ